ncbi:MAG: Unknown protein [uncultured Sulfurovum sp.]|uniref:PIN domain-containing protein n=1 Tax=uncultured Sulfurovum sp. TaxID=269237 RepID=A0A6S6SBI3_9BACT|nr:MAG: Unknown protein [uncultured Sulfurovum sp.]
MKIFLDANICLDLLDTTRPTSRASVAWYMGHKDDVSLSFHFSGDFITTFYYILTERKKIDKYKVVQAIDLLCMEVTPFYLNHTDFVEAKNSFFNNICDDFEDLMVLHSTLRAGCTTFMTNDNVLLNMSVYKGLLVQSTKGNI